MSNTSILEEEYNEYVRLSNERNTLESSLRELSGHNDEDSIRRINEISKRLGEINNELSLYDQNTLTNIQNYFNLRNRFNELSRDIKAIEELSKEGKRPNRNVEFVTLTSSEGRSKQIDKSLASDYMKLVEEKIRLKNSLNRNYELVKSKISMKNGTIKKEIDTDRKIDYILPEIKEYDDLSVEDKIKETKERLERIFASSNLPNMGKKIVVTYNSKKYEVPEKYQGIFKSTYLELRKLENMLNDNKKNEDMMTIPELNLDGAANEKESMSADYKIFDKSIKRDEEIYAKLGVPFDSEKQKRINELVAIIFNSRNDDLEEVRFREGVKQKVNTAKGYVTITSKKVVSSLKENTKKVGIKVDGIKKSAKEKSKDVSYQIVNRTVKFKENTCQKVNEKKSKFASIGKNVLEKIRRPFDNLREKREDFVTKKDLLEMVNLLKEQNQLLLEQNKALTRKLVNNSGFVSTAAFIIITSVLITIVIFLVVGFIVFR